MRKAGIVLLLLLLMPWASADVVVWQGPDSSPDNAGLEPANSTHVGFTIPSNATITNSSFEIAPQWVEAENNGTYWAGDSLTGFSLGTSNGTSSLNVNGDLTLAPESSYGVMTNFETTQEQFSTWSVHGDDVWRPVNLTAVSHGPTNASNGNIVAGTNGTVLPGSYSILRSQFWDVPAVVRHFNLTFDKWMSFDDSDYAAVEVSHDSGQSWFTLDTWNGSDEVWKTEHYNLDSLSLQTTIGFRFIINTSLSTGIDEGLFIDSFNLSNQGEPLGAWLHGNASGQYSVWADGRLVVPVDLSGLTGPLEFVYWSNWDIEGDYNDNLVIMISLDNASTWTIMSPLPGVPGLGIPSGGTTYNQQSYGWRSVHHPFPSWVAGHTNASNALMMFRVTTDGVKSYGGSAVDGWEGIMIDDLAVQSTSGSSGMTLQTFANLTNVSNHQLVNTSGYPNDWQYVTWEGHNGPWHTSDSFEAIQTLPRGWRIDHERGTTPWEIGVIDNSGGFGPNNTAWPSGYRGMGINLDGLYAHKVYTHLVSPTYSIPEGSSARLTFSHWVCTEAAWDGGSIFTSIDDGLTWQHFGDNLTGFYERVSQVNTNSPFHTHGIFDGSTVPNGCGKWNANHTFQRISGDMSSLAGNDVKVRFSFFSDAYLQEDGWYIDDAGIEIDRFELEGEWVSPPIEADEAGWAMLSGLTSTPAGTGIGVSVLDSNGSVIPGYHNRTLPIKLDIPSWQHDTLSFKVNMWSDNEELTPRLKSLQHGMAIHLNAENIAQLDTSNRLQYNSNGTVTNNDSQMVLLTLPEIPVWRPYSSINITSDSIYQIQTVYNVASYSLDSQIPTGQNIRFANTYTNATIELDAGPHISSSNAIYIPAGSTFSWIHIEPNGLLSPLNTSIDFGVSGVNEWEEEGSSFHKLEIDRLKINGSIQPGGTTTIPAGSSYEIEIDILTPYSVDGEYRYWELFQGGVCIGIDSTSCTWREMTEAAYSTDIINGIEHRYSTLRYSSSSSASDEVLISKVNLLRRGEYEFTIPSSTIESLLPQSTGEMTNLSVLIESDRGGLLINGTISHEPAVFDDWITLPQQTLYPGNTVSASSTHSILEGTPELDIIELFISPTRSIDDAIAEFRIDNLELGGRFLQISGAGVIQLDSNNCSWNGSVATWSVTGQWMLDDYARLNWLVQARNMAYETLGPAHGVSGSSMFAASTNDLEVFDVQAYYGSVNLLDQSQVAWPIHIAAGQEIDVGGHVRYSGLAGINPSSEDYTLELQIVLDENVIASTVVDVGNDGSFQTTVTTPEDESLNSLEMKIIPTFTSIGPDSTTSALDVTAESWHMPFILDIENPEVMKLEILSPGMIQPADGSVWYPGQDIPLRLTVIDDNGLPQTLSMGYSTSGSPYQWMNINLPAGQTEAVVDLPLINEMSVFLSGQQYGWLNVVIEGYDLAGNELLGGGNSSNPLANISVQYREETYLSPDDLSLSRYDGQLFPGNTNRFSFSLVDGNGLHSLDSIQFGLTNDDDKCVIEYRPWNGEIIHDVGCLIKPPRVHTSQIPSTSTWLIDIDFELRWDVADHIGEGEFTPWLFVNDEGARTGSGFTSMSPYSWSLHTDLQLFITDVEDITAPKGMMVDDIIHIHAQDIIDINLEVRHNGTDSLAQNLPFTTLAELVLIGDMGFEDYEEQINSDGTVKIRVVFDQAKLGTQVRINADLSSVAGHNISGDYAYIQVDTSPPTVIVSSGYLVSIDSDSLGEVPVEISIHDSNAISDDPVVMNWIYLRNGRLLSDSQGSVELPLLFVGTGSNLYGATVDMNTQVSLQKGDSLMIWFIASDASGRGLTGTGSSEIEPIETMIRWIAYEPKLGELVTTPYRPMVGEVIDISFRIANIGSLDGNTTVRLIDGEGTILDETEFNIPSGMFVYHSFEVEAWDEGNLGLKLEIVGQEPVPVPLGIVESNEGKSGDSEFATLGLAVLSVFLAGLALLAARSRKEQKFYDSFDSILEEE